VDAQEMEICLDLSILKELQPQNGYFSFFAVSNVKTDMFCFDFCTKAEQCEWLTDIYKNG